MKKLFIFGLSCFLVSFILGTIVWFGFEKSNNPLKLWKKHTPKTKLINSS